MGELNRICRSGRKVVATPSRSSLSQTQQQRYTTLFVPSLSYCCIVPLLFSCTTKVHIYIPLSFDTRRNSSNLRCLEIDHSTNTSPKYLTTIFHRIKTILLLHNHQYLRNIPPIINTTSKSPSSTKSPIPAQHSPNNYLK